MYAIIFKLGIKYKKGKEEIFLSVKKLKDP